MSATLYLLRQQPGHISPVLLQASDVNIDIVFVEQATSMAASCIESLVVTDKRIDLDSSRRALTYDDLIDKIFTAEHVIVL
jgi:hypothetical protein